MIGCSVRSRVSQGFRFSSSRLPKRPRTLRCTRSGVKFVSTSTSADGASDPPVPPVPPKPEIVQPSVGAEEISSLDSPGLSEPLLKPLTASSDWSLLGQVQNGLEYVHVTTGLPWWATIVVSTLAVKTLLFPFSYIQARSNEKLAHGAADMRALFNYYAQTLSLYKDTGGVPGSLAYKSAIQVVRQIDRRAGSRATTAYIRGLRGIAGLHGAYPSGLFAAPLANIPIFMTFVWATRRLVLSGTVDGVASGGTLWFTDLSHHDVYGALPLAAVACTYIGTEISMGQRAKEFPTGFYRVLKEVLQYVSILSIPFVATLPNGVFMYWIPSSLFSTAQLLAMKNTRFRGLLGLGPWPPAVNNRMNEAFKPPPPPPQTYTSKPNPTPTEQNAEVDTSTAAMSGVDGSRSSSSGSGVQETGNATKSLGQQMLERTISGHGTGAPTTKGKATPPKKAQKAKNSKKRR